MQVEIRFEVPATVDKNEPTVAVHWTHVPRVGDRVRVPRYEDQELVVDQVIWADDPVYSEFGRDGRPTVTIRFRN